MKKSEKIDQEIKDTLQVLDDINKASPKPFFYTRLEARIQRRYSPATTWSLRPAVIWSGIVLIVLLNITVAINYSKKANDSVNEQNAGAFANEYGLNIDALDSN